MGLGVPRFARNSGSFRACKKLPHLTNGTPEALQDLDSGQTRLQELGYVPELQRHFGLLGTVCYGFSSMAYLASITGSFPLGLQYGGAVCVLWGWVLTSILQLPVGLALAELASSFPLAGGPFSWCVELTGNDSKYLVIAWVTGWLHVLGQFASTMGLAYLTALQLAAMRDPHSGHTTKQDNFLVYSVVLLAAGFLCSFPVKHMRRFSIYAAMWMMGSGAVLSVLLLACAPRLQPSHFLFLGFTAENKSLENIPNNTYLFLLGMLGAGFGYIRLESPAQLAEETKRADATVPWGIVMSLPLNSIFGAVYNLVLLACLPEDYLTMAADGSRLTVPGLYYYIFQQRFGVGAVGTFFSMLPLLACFNTTVISMLTSSRLLWSFARDGGMPFYQVWAAVCPCTEAPFNAVWTLTALGYLLGLVMIWVPAAFTAMVSITGLGLYLSYAAPIVLRMVFRDSFEPGPFTLDVFSMPVMVAATASIAFSVALLVLPRQFPIDLEDLNWAPITAGVVIVAAVAAWYFPVRGASVCNGDRAQATPDPDPKGNEKSVEGGPTSPSSPQDASKMPLMDFLTSEVPKQYSPDDDTAGQDPMTRQRSAEVVFSRQAGLFTVDSQSGKAVELKPDMLVAQQLRRQLGPRLGRRQKIVDLIRRRSSDLGRRASASLDIIREGAKTPRSMAREAAVVPKTAARDATLARAASIPARPSQDGRPTLPTMARAKSMQHDRPQHPFEMFAAQW